MSIRSDNMTHVRAVLRGVKGITARRVATRLGLSADSARVALNDLVAAGEARRELSDPEGRGRRSYIYRRVEDSHA